MEPTTPITTSNDYGEPIRVNKEPQNSPKNPSSITVISMALFVLMSLGIVGFLYYQNQQLKGMLANYQATPSASPTTTQTPTDKTSDWETYIGKSNDYSIKHPKGLKSDNNGAEAQYENIRFSYMGPSQIASGRTQTELSDRYFFTITKIGKTTQFNVKTEIAKDLANSKVNCTQDNAKLSSIAEVKVENVNALQYSASCMGDYTITYLSDGKNTYSITEFYTSQAYKAVTDQILSTFKFISPSPSPIPLKTPISVSTSSGAIRACAMEAKICPDGSSVGRSGPNCEFAACPTPK